MLVIKCRTSYFIHSIQEFYHWVIPKTILFKFKFITRHFFCHCAPMPVSLNFNIQVVSWIVKLLWPEMNDFLKQIDFLSMGSCMNYACISDHNYYHLICFSQIIQIQSFLRKCRIWLTLCLKRGWCSYLPVTY
jgi:hypothetical protein